MTDPRPVPLDLAPLPEAVRRVLARHPDAPGAAAAADAIAGVADLVCSRFAVGGRLLVLAADQDAAAVTAGVERRFTHEYGFAPGAVEVVAASDAVRATPRDVVVEVTTAAPAAPRGPGAWAVLTTDPLTATGDDVVALATTADLYAALDALATAVAAHLGHLHDEHPVDLVADTDEDRVRVEGVVAAIAGVDATTAHAAATAAGHDVRVAVLVLAGLPLADATTLAANRRTLRDALANLPRRGPGDRGHGATSSDPRARMAP